MNGLKIIGESCITDVLSLLGAVAIGCLFARRRKVRFIGWLVVYIVCDDIVGLLPIVFHWNFGRWKWIRQTASLAWGLFVATRFFSKEDVRLRLPHARSEVLRTIGGILVALAIAIGPALVGHGTHPSLETFAYQATYPGPVEELAFRGIGLALLLKAFSSAPADFYSQFGTAIQSVG